VSSFLISHIEDVSVWGWAIFAVVVLSAVAFDLGLFRKHGSEQNDLSVRSAALRSAGWIGLAILFGIGLMVLDSPAAGLTFLTAYVLEESSC
jgi:tellurite resistance protein TerC